MKTLKKLMTAVMILTSLTANADNLDDLLLFRPRSPTCNETLNLCDEALRDQIKVSELQKAIIEDHEKKTYLLEQQNQQLRDDSTQWYKNPWLTGSLGFGLGAILMGVLKK